MNPSRISVWMLPIWAETSERFAETEEVVRLIRETDEAARQSAHAAVEADRLLALFLHLQENIDGARFDVALQIRIFGFDRIEIAELIKPQEAQFPKAIAEHLPFVQQQLAPDHFVARRRIAGKLDPPHEELLLLVELQRQVDHLLRIVHVEQRFGVEIDISVIAVEFPEIVERLADLVRVEDIALFQRENSLQEFRFEDQALVGVGAAEVELPHPVLRPFFDLDRDIRRLPVLRADAGHRYRNPGAIQRDGLQSRLFHVDPEIPVILVEAANPDFQVLVQLRPVERLGHNRDFGYVEGNRDRPVVLHRANDFPRRERLVAHDRDRPYFHFRPFVDVEDEFDGVRRGDALVGGFDGRELPPVLRQQFFDHHFGVFDLRGIELALHR